jgi:hypothetical protein
MGCAAIVQGFDALCIPNGGAIERLRFEWMTLFPMLL